MDKQDLFSVFRFWDATLSGLVHSLLNVRMGCLRGLLPHNICLHCIYICRRNNQEFGSDGNVRTTATYNSTPVCVVFCYLVKYVCKSIVCWRCNYRVVGQHGADTSPLFDLKWPDSTHPTAIEQVLNDASMLCFSYSSPYNIW